MNEAELRQFEERVLNVIKLETHEAIKTTGHAWIEDAVRKITPVAIRETLITIGIQPEPPFESQKDFHYLRQTRLESEDIKKTIKKTVVGYCINGLLTLVISCAAYWVMVKNLVAKVP